MIPQRVTQPEWEKRRYEISAEVGILAQNW
jgi:hypothetical protein